MEANSFNICHQSFDSLRLRSLKIITASRCIASCLYSLLLHTTTSPMASDKNGAANGGSTDFTVKAGLAQMLKGGVIMDVVNAEQVCSLWLDLVRAKRERGLISLTGPYCGRGRCCRCHGS